MNSVEGAPVSNLSAVMCDPLRKSLEELCKNYAIDVVLEEPLLLKSMMFFGDYLAGIRVNGQGFHGAVTLAMERPLAKSFANQIFAGAAAKTDESMLCDLVGEVCNQLTGVIQRALGQMGCKMRVSAQENIPSSSNFEVAPMPEEWLFVPFRVQTGRGVLGFGCAGRIVVGKDPVQEDATKPRQITFF